MARGAGKGKSGAKGKGKAAPRRSNEKSVRRDVYSDDEDEAAEAKLNATMDIDSIYEYEPPETIEQDSEIDEDEAFDSDDEEQYGMFFNGKRPTATDNDNDEEGDEDEDDAEGGDLLSDMLGTAPAKRLTTAGGDDDGSDDDDDALLASDSDEDEDDDDAAKQQRLKALVDGLVPRKESKKRKQPAEITEASTLAAALRSGSSDSNAATTTSALTLSSLLGSTGDDSTAGKAAKQLRELETAMETSGPLGAMTAPVVEERAARKLAYEQKKEEVDLFQPVVKRNRQKETMDFREQIPKLENLTAAGLAGKFSAETSLEKDVAALLAAGGLSSDKSVAQQEHDELAANKVSVEEVAARQKELAKLRSLMFYEEQKQRRVKKIKSKLYHKIRNNQNAKEAEKQKAQLRQLDPALAQQLDEELATKRAEERLTLKHTNTSKWVKHQLKRGVLADNGTRGAIAEQLRRGQELRRKMDTANSDDDDDDLDGDEDDGEDGEGGGDAATLLQRRLQRQTRALVTEIDGDAGAEAGGLAGMKFMQRAVEKQRLRAKTEAEKLLRELNGQDVDGLLSDGDADSDSATASGRKRKKRKTAAVKTAQPTEQDKQKVAMALQRGTLQTGTVAMDRGQSARAGGAIAVDLGDGTASSGGVSVAASSAAAGGATVQLGQRPQVPQNSDTSADVTMSAVPEENPWLSSAVPGGKKKKNKKNKAAKGDSVDVGSALESLAQSVAASEKTKTSKAKTETVSLDIGAAVTAAVGSKRKADAVLAGPSTTPAKASKTTADTAAQDALVKRAFAFADEGEDALQAEKETLAARDTQAQKGAELAKLVGMAGWGSWAGDGVTKSFRQQQREEHAVRLAESTKRQVLARRADAKLAHVLINEKKDKRAAKFTVQEVPYPFTSREEYEMAMRNPLGSDWNTPAATNALTKPKVMTRAGQMIDPLKLSKEDKKQAKKELSKQRKAKF